MSVQNRRLIPFLQALLRKEEERAVKRLSRLTMHNSDYPSLPTEPVACGAAAEAASFLVSPEWQRLIAVMALEFEVRDASSLAMAGALVINSGTTKEDSPNIF